MKNVNEYAAYPLTAKNIDLLSEKTREIMEAGKIDRKNIIRLRLSVEEILLCWMDKLGEGTVCRYSSGRRFGKCYITLSVAGQRVNPYESTDMIEFGSGEMQNNILSALGLTPLYQYINGENRITLMPLKKKMNPFIGLGIAVGAAVILGLLGKSLLPAAAGGVIAKDIIGPLYKAFLRMLSAVSGPLMFLSVVWGMYNIGDTATLSMIGKRMIGRFFAVQYIVLVLFALLTMNFFYLSLLGSGGTGKSLFSDIYQMLLAIIPSNIIEPFSSNNSLQIVFLAFVAGLAMLILAKKTASAAQLVEQSNFIVQLVMETISTMVPAFIFCSILMMLLSDDISKLASTAKFFVLYMATTLLLLALFILSLSIRKKVSPVLIIKKLLPTFLIAFTTASSSAAFATNVNDCVKKLGIDERIVNFGVPLGSVMFKMGSCISSLVLCLFMAELFEVPITISFILMAVIISGILSIACPPIPGGALAIFTILFAQLGIPGDAVAIAIAYDALLDFPITAVNLACLQVELAIVADHLGMLDEKILRS